MDPFSPDVVRDYEPIHPKGTDWRGLLRKIWAPIAAVIGIAIKFGVAFAKFASIFVAVGGYALIWGWRFGIGFVALIFVHEMGHFVEARRQGIHAALPVFIPFVGAIVTGVIAVLVALVAKGLLAAVWVVLVLILVGELEGHVLQPLLLGRAVRLHPLAVVLPVATGFLLIGVIGALLAVPVVAVVDAGIRSLYQPNPVNPDTVDPLNPRSARPLNSKTPQATRDRAAQCAGQQAQSEEVADPLVNRPT